MPPAAALTFEQIRAASREALTELRRVLGLLREDDTAAEPGPQPELGELPELVEGARLAGVAATLSMSGTATAPAAPPGSGLALVGMRERVHMLGGTPSVGQEAGGGFEVLATFPRPFPR